MTGHRSGHSKADQQRRRPRRSVGERNFICGCSKAYLSYPALYTHVRNKHEGTFPEGSKSQKDQKSKKALFKAENIPASVYLQNHMEGTAQTEPWVTTFNFTNPISLNGEHSVQVLVYIRGIFKQMLSKFVDNCSDHVMHGSLKDTDSLDHLYVALSQNITPEVFSLQPLRASLDQFVSKYGNQQKKSLFADRRCFFLEKRDLMDYTKVIAQFAACVASVTSPKHQAFLNELVVVLNFLRDAVHVWGHRFTHGEPKEVTSTMDEEKTEPRSWGIIMIANYFIQELYPGYIKQVNWYDGSCSPRPKKAYFDLTPAGAANLIRLFKWLNLWFQCNDWTDIKLDVLSEN